MVRKLAPVIGITAGTPPVRPYDVLLEPSKGLFLSSAYWKRIWAVGGTPFVIPPGDPDRAQECLSRLDGLLLSGGPDLDPLYFNEEPRTGTGRIDPERDVWELMLAKMGLVAGIPILAVCRGMQVLNVVAGGSIYQDLDQDLAERGRVGLKHFQEAPAWHPTHSVRIAPDNFLSQAMGLRGASARVRVNSFHHQAVNSVAAGFEVVALAEDGVIEAIQCKMHPFVIGVQWHPEFLDGDGLFAMFVDACRPRRVPM